MTYETAPAGPDPAASDPAITDESHAPWPVSPVPAVPKGPDHAPFRAPDDISPPSSPAPPKVFAANEPTASFRPEERQGTGPQAYTGNESQIGNWSGGYSTVAAFPAHAQVDIGTAGLVAHQVGPVTIAPQIRVRDVLSGTPQDRNAIRNDQSYLEAAEWSQAWKEAVRALPENRVIIVVAPRSYGSTTFSLRLLACHAPEDADLIRLEADWDSPKIGKLPVQEHRAYQLDLQDPAHDRFDGAFLNGLGMQSADLRAVGSCLVLAVADELWPGHHGQIPAEVSVVRLDNPPDALQLVEQHLTAHGLRLLVPYVRQPEAGKHIQGRDAVQAMRAVDAVLRQWQEHRHQRDAERKSLPAEPQQQAAELDPSLKQAIVEALGAWQDDLDKLFGEPGRASSNGRSLTAEDRCLLMSLAMHQTGTATEIESSAFALEQRLCRSHPAVNGETTDAWGVFSRRGLRPRLRAFKAVIDGRDRVTFNRPGYAEAVLGYVWENYSGLRDELVTWMVRCASADIQRVDPASETLTALILRLQDADRLVSLRDSAISQGRRDVIVRVMTAAANDEHMGRRSRSLLYEWASQKAEVQHVVTAVCRQLIGVKKDTALVRLRRVASHAADANVGAQVLEAFRDIAADREATSHFAETVAGWQRADRTSRAVKLGLLALLATERNSIPWIPSHPTAIDVTGGLRELLSDLSSLPETVSTLVGWLRSCTQDEVVYATARGLMAGAVSDRHAFNAGITIMKELAQVRTPDGGSVGEDLYADVTQPELRSLNPLIRPET